MHRIVYDLWKPEAALQNIWIQFVSRDPRVISLPPRHLLSSLVLLCKESFLSQHLAHEKRMQEKEELKHHICRDHLWQCASFFSPSFQVPFHISWVYCGNILRRSSGIGSKLKCLHILALGWSISRCSRPFSNFR